MGGKSTSTSAPRIAQLAVQTSSLGLPISLGWGRGRLKCNLLWYNAFKATSHTTKQGGKGMGGSSTNTTYTYTASVIMGLCEGPITGIRSVYRDKDVYKDYIRSWSWNGQTYGTVVTTALQQAGLNLATGTTSQTPWGYMTSRFPSQALAYRGISYVYAQDYPLTDNATLPNHSFEVDFAVQLAGLPDADPKDIVTDLLTNANYGLPGWGSGLIGDLSTWSTYCKANNLLLSPVLEEQRSARDLINEWCDATNSAAFWSEGQLKIGTFGDTAATANGATFTPNLTPQYNLTEDDFQPLSAGVPVQLEIIDQSDAYNIVQVEFLDRNNQYNVAITAAQDLANITQYGKRKKDPVSWHSICDPQIARNACQLLLQRVLYRREVYRFKLPWNFVLLEPMDYVSLTTTTDQLKLSAKLVQIIDIEESEDDYLTITAEGVNVGTASTPAYNQHSGSAVSVQTQVAPGAISTPLIFNAPPSLTGLDPELWIAVAGQSGAWGGCEVWASPDNVTFERVGRIDNGAKTGVSTSAIGNVADPDTTSTLGVNMAASQQQLNSSSATNMNNGSTLFMLGDELMAYQTATLTGANAYNLTTLRRGLYGTTTRAHAINEPFARMDDSVFKLPYNKLNYGNTIYLKFLSFNIFGQELDQLSSATAYSVSLLNSSSATNYRDVASTAQQIANSKNATFRQTTPPSTASLGDYWTDIDDSNASYRYEGNGLADVNGNLTDGGGQSLDGPWQPILDQTVLGALTLIADQGISTTDNSTSLNAIQSDGILARGEKPEVNRQYSVAAGEYSNWVSRAQSFGVTTELTAYQTAYANLASYIGSINAFFDTSVDTPINASSFSSAFTSYYNARQALVAKIDEVAATKATWSGVTGSGKPADNATVGAPVGTNVGSTPATTVEGGAVAANNGVNSDGTIKNDKVATPAIQANAVTNANAASGTSVVLSNSGATTLVSLTITTNGGALYIQGDCLLNFSSTTFPSFRLKRNGSQLAYMTVGSPVQPLLQFFDQPVAGTYTITIELDSLTGGGTGTGWYPTIFALEMKR